MSAGNEIQNRVPVHVLLNTQPPPYSLQATMKRIPNVCIRRWPSLAHGFGVLLLLGGLTITTFAAENTSFSDATTTVHRIRESGKTIYAPLGAEEQSLWLTNLALEEILDRELQGVSVEGLPLRTRSKVVKTAVCKALGYPAPKAFTQTQPRFPGQNFDVYIQKSNNLQVWNEALEASRRYVLIRVSPHDTISRVKVVDGATLAKLDRSGKLTGKFQARFTVGTNAVDLASSADTEHVQKLLGTETPAERFSGSPVDPPTPATFIPISDLARRLSVMIGARFADAGHDQERNRGTELHRRMCHVLGYGHYRDDGACPDITAQLIEVKLQTSTTIDLGIFQPDSDEQLSLPTIEGEHLRHCDVRYAIFAGDTDGDTVTLTHMVLVTGEDLFKRFRPFGGRVLNKKLQISLPSDFFDAVR
jgi:hypothetical protein